MAPRVQSAEERKYLQTATFRLVRDEAGRRGRPAVDCAHAGNKMPIYRMFSAGATGLEPATSGVTGLHREEPAGTSGKKSRIHALPLG
jgi:hypothetical protein